MLWNGVYDVAAIKLFLDSVSANLPCCPPKIIIVSNHRMPTTNALTCLPTLQGALRTYLPKTAGHRRWFSRTCIYLAVMALQVLELHGPACQIGAVRTLQSRESARCRTRYLPSVLVFFLCWLLMVENSWDDGITLKKNPRTWFKYGHIPNLDWLGLSRD